MANWFKRNTIKEEQRAFDETWNNPILGTLSLISGNNYQASKALKLSTVYRAVQVISDSVAILPIDIFEYKENWKYKQYNDLYYLLNVTPNPFMSAYTMKKMMIQFILLQGNAYLLLSRNQTGDIVQITLLDSNKMIVRVNDNDITYNYGSTVYDKADIVHIMNYSTDGITGKSVISYASMALEGSYAAEEHSNNFFSRGGSMAGILRPLAGVTLNDQKGKNAKDKFINALNSEMGGASNSIVVLDAGLEYQPITVNPKDAQLLESREFNLITIAQFFGVSPHKLFDLKGANYSSVEASQIEFLNSTIQPLLEKIELELYRKIYTRVEYDFTELKFDVSNLLRMDSASAATYYSQLYNMGAISTNEIREKINAGYPAKGGNEHFIQVNLQKLSEPLVNNQPVDNKLK